MSEREATGAVRRARLVGYRATPEGAAVHKGREMRRTVGIAFAVALLVVSACGSRVSDEEAEQSQQEQLGEGDGGNGTSDGTSDGTDDPLFPTDAEGQVMFGDIPSPCGDGDASSETDVGVSSDSIVIHSIADPGAPVEGLNEGIHEGIKAFVDWCNAQGGVNGRELELVLADAAFQYTRERVLEACDQAFAMVGSGAVFDRDGAQEAVDCGIADVPAFTVYPEKALAERMVQPMPNPPTSYPVGAGMWIAEEFPEVIDHAASLYIGTGDVALEQSERHIQAYEQIGYDFVMEEPVNLGETNFGPTVAALRNAEVQYLTYTGVYQEFVNLQTALRDQGYEIPVVDLEANFYNAEYVEVAGDVADGTFVRVTIWPFEEADQNPATQQFLDILGEYQPEAAPELLGVHAFSAGLLFATALKELGDDVTRDGLLEELSNIHEWDGGGLHQMNDPGNNSRGGCFVMMQVQDGAFQRAYPDEGWACPEGGVVEITGYEDRGAKAD